MNGRGLGWKPPETRDPRNWPAKRLMAMVEAGEAVPVKWDLPIGALSQESTPHCVGFTGAAFIACAQAEAPGDATVTDALGHEIYYQCKDKEGIPAGDPRREEGSSIYTLMKVLKDRGAIGAYAFGGFDDHVEWVSRYGPTCLGTNWYTQMFFPDQYGAITPGGEVEGGHAYLGRGVNHPVAGTVATLNRNSWSPGWGRIPDMPGDFYMSHSHTKRLLDDEYGECGMAVKFVKDLPPVRWPDLEGLDLNADDLLSQDAVWRQGIMKGYPDGNFRPQPPPGRSEDDPDPNGRVTRHQVGTVMVRLGVLKTNPWNSSSDYAASAERGWVHQQLPDLRFDEERWDEKLTRLQLCLLVGRKLRGV